jgi:hypothetical protein
MIALYGVPTVPSGKVPALTTSAAGSTCKVIEPDVEAVGEPESLAFTISTAVPAVVGVPDMVQPEPSVRPDGSVPEDMLQE